MTEIKLHPNPHGYETELEIETANGTHSFYSKENADYLDEILYSIFKSKSDFFINLIDIEEKSYSKTFFNFNNVISATTYD